MCSHVLYGCSSKDREDDTMLYDTWSNIKYKGSELDDVELDFVLKKSATWFNIGTSVSNQARFTVTTAGINEREQIRRGDIRKLTVICRTDYTQNEVQLIDGIDIRVYVKDGTREVDVIEWDKVDKTFLENSYVIDTNILMPQRYHVDIRITYGMESIIHHDILSFNVVDILNNKYA